MRRAVTPGGEEYIPRRYVRTWGGHNDNDHSSPSISGPFDDIELLRVLPTYTLVYMKTMIDVDPEALASAARELGTTTKKDTVNAALEFVADRRRRIEQLLDDPFAFGVGADIGDQRVMKDARR